MNEITNRTFCVYCGSGTKVYDAQAKHPYVANHGPFRILECTVCGSLQTDPLPSSRQLNELYQQYQKGMFDGIAELRRKFPLHAWFAHCLRRIRALVPKGKSDFVWVDVGAGDGIMSEIMMRAFPSSVGYAVDIHQRPKRLDGLPVNWLQLDLNTAIQNIPKADLIFSITVAEHVSKPDDFLQGLMNQLNDGGSLYLNCPRADALARRILGKRWPYYLPGEHITIPSRRGMKILLQKLAKDRFGGKAIVQVDGVTMPYPLGYYLGYYLGWKFEKYLWNPDIFLPTGLLEATVTSRL